MVFSESQPGPDFLNSKEGQQIKEFASACKKFEQDYDRADSRGSVDMNEWVKWEGRKLLDSLVNHPMRDKLALAATSGVPSEVFGVIQEILGHLPSDMPDYKTH